MQKINNIGILVCFKKNPDFTSPFANLLFTNENPLTPFLRAFLNHLYSIFLCSPLDTVSKKEYRLHSAEYRRLHSLFGSFFKLSAWYPVRQGFRPKSPARNSNTYIRHYRFGSHIRFHSSTLQIRFPPLPPRSCGNVRAGE